MSEITKQETTETNIGIGIDPGWVSLGAAIVEKVEPFKFKALFAGTFDVEGQPLKFAERLNAQLTSSIPYCSQEVSSRSQISIERYAAYKGIHSPHTELITMLVGVLYHSLSKYQLHSESIQSGNQVSLVRAIDWKVYLAKILAKHTGFQNPSPELDKKFSVAAAKHLLVNPEIIKDDHQADAICLACHRLLGSFNA